MTIFCHLLAFTFTSIFLSHPYFYRWLDYYLHFFIGPVSKLKVFVSESKFNSLNSKPLSSSLLYSSLARWISSWSSQVISITSNNDTDIYLAVLVVTFYSFFNSTIIFNYLILRLLLMVFIIILTFICFMFSIFILFSNSA